MPTPKNVQNAVFEERKLHTRASARTLEPMSPVCYPRLTAHVLASISVPALLNRLWQNGIGHVDEPPPGRPGFLVPLESCSVAAASKEGRPVNRFPSPGAVVGGPLALAQARRVPSSSEDGGKLPNRRVRASEQRAAPRQDSFRHCVGPWNLANCFGTADTAIFKPANGQSRVEVSLAPSSRPAK